MQMLLFGQGSSRTVKPFKTQLLKWVGNKQRFAGEIASYFPAKIKTYFEPFLGSGAVLGTLAPEKAIATDSFEPLIEIWKTLKEAPETLKRWYGERFAIMAASDRVEGYEKIKASYNSNPNPADLLFICRSCYGGVVRFRQRDGYCSTPCGIHDPISPESFAHRVDLWHKRTSGANFARMEYEEAMELASAGDLIYCDPPYSHSQAILYGAQSFDLKSLFSAIERCKRREVWVVLSIDGTKKSGNQICDLPIPDGLFEREVFVQVGRSMLLRFQKEGESLEQEVVSDRLLLTY